MKEKAKTLATYRPSHKPVGALKFVLYTPSNSDESPGNTATTSTTTMPRYTSRRLSLQPCRDSGIDLTNSKTTESTGLSVTVARAVSFSSAASRVDGDSIRRIRESDSPRPKPRSSHKTVVFKRERRIFVTVSCILLTYLVCWIPFHIVFDIMIFNKDIVPDEVFYMAFILAYINSTINPLLYAYSNREFRAAFKKVLLFKFCCK